MIEIVKNIIRFVVLILLQVLVFNRIEISIFLSPMILVYFLIAMPFTTHKSLLLISSFFMGIIVDMFMNTMGILSFTFVLIAYFRPFILQIIQPRDGYALADLPRAVDLGWAWFMKFATILTVFFHLIYFVIIGFSQDNFLIMLWKTIISSAFTLLFIIIIQVFSHKQ